MPFTILQIPGRMKVCLLLISSFFYVVGDAPPPAIDLPLGRLEGTVKKSFSGRDFFSFEGVPYARPPVGKYRFREPKPPKPWVGTWKANTIYKCMQYNHLTLIMGDPFLGQEDCLYLNIYTPNLKPSKLLDVLFYIHGGAFMFHYGGGQGPLYVMDKDIVYVNINYRLGPLGFLTTEDDVVPGNIGLKDQVFALKWVNENIAYFGGNPKSITIMGMSAGGASVHLHYLMPESRGLFQRGFSLSGSALCPWVLMENGAEKTRKLASLIGCDFEEKDNVEMIDCMRRKPGQQIVEAVQHFLAWLYNPFSPFGVVVDSWASSPVLPEHPYTLLKKKKVADVPWISSYMTVEGLYPGAEFYSDKYLKEIDTRWNELMPFILDYNYTVDPKLHSKVGEEIRKYYLKDKKVDTRTFSDLIEVMSDRLFVNDIEKAIRMQAIATKSPIYLFLLNYRGTHSHTEFLCKCNDNLGVSHADDIKYIYSTPVDVTTNKEDRMMMTLLVNFTISYTATGKPEVPIDWSPIEKTITGPLDVFRINSATKLSMDRMPQLGKPQLGRKEFWDSLPIIENEKLVSPFRDDC